MHDMVVSGVLRGQLKLVLGRVVSAGLHGECWLDLPISAGPIRARLSATAARHHERLSPGADVLAACPIDGDEPPIVMDIVSPSSDLEPVVSTENGEDSPSRLLEINGRQVTIAAGDEISLKCGRSSITLQRNGKIVIKGDHLINYSRGANRIKGASVKIN